MRANSAEANTPINVGPNASAPWLTVIIPSYRGEQWIASALTSLAAEPTDGIEVLVIDSSPTPATRSIAQGYSDRLRLKVFERCDLQSWQQKTNFGVASAESSHVCWPRASGQSMDRSGPQCSYSPCTERDNRPRRPKVRGMAVPVAS